MTDNQINIKSHKIDSTVYFPIINSIRIHFNFITGKGEKNEEMFTVFHVSILKMLMNKK